MKKCSGERKLALMKKAVNTTTKIVDRVVPATSSPYASEVTNLVDRIFARVEERVRKETNIHVPIQDENFLRFVRVFRKSLIYLMNWDCYYERWVRYILVVVVDEAIREFDSLDKSASDKWLFYIENLSESLGKVLLKHYLREEVKK